MKLLLTGFEPFGGSSVNPSQEIVRALAGRHFPGVEIATALLPVDSERGPAEALLAVQTCRPDAVLSLGQANGRAVLSIERVALNLADYAMPDNAGTRAADQPVVTGGPAAYFVTLPVRALLAAVRAANIPAELSLSAGTFLCNQVLYAVLHHIAASGVPTRAGFIHVPSLPEQVANRPENSSRIPSMSLETMIAGVSAAITAIGLTT
jgi:pyroglutamyl-peptidase